MCGVNRIELNGCSPGQPPGTAFLLAFANTTKPLQRHSVLVVLANANIVIWHRFDFPYSILDY
jgi:hypothetical protein